MRSHFPKLVDPHFIHNWYFAALGIASLAAQLLRSNNFSLQILAYLSGAISLLAAALPAPVDYQDKYARYPALHPTWTLAVRLLLLLILTNFLASGVGGLIMGHAIIATTRAVLPWIAIHALVAVTVTCMVYLTVCRTAESPVSRSNLFSLATIAALVTGALFTPVGTIGYWIRMARVMDDAMTTLLIKSLVTIPTMAILNAILCHFLLLSITEMLVRSSILRSMELIVGSAALYSILLYFTSFIGNLEDKYKDPIYVVVAFQYALLFVSTFHVFFWLMNVTKASYETEGGDIG